MIWQILTPLIAAIFGTTVGSLLTWYLMTVSARKQARREILLKTAYALEAYRVAYALWYGEYLSPTAQQSGPWAKPPGGGDPRYLSLMKAVDMGRGRLRALIGALYAHFREDEIRPLYKDITEVLVKSGPQHADCRDVDIIVEKACDLIPGMIRRSF